MPDNYFFLVEGTPLDKEQEMDFTLEDSVSGNDSITIALPIDQKDLLQPLDRNININANPEQSMKTEQNPKRDPQSIGAHVCLGDIDENQKIFHYPQVKPSSREKNLAKRIMVIGQTGSGKSTLLDAMINYLVGVEFTDKFRYKLVDETKVIKQKNGQSVSITDNVQEYYIKDHWIGQTYILIDTPGFMDTRGVQRDYEIVRQIDQFFREHVDSVHSMCIVCPSSLVRLTVAQKFVFNSMLQMFGKDVADVINVLFTFCDGGDPQAKVAVEADGIPFKEYFKFNNSALFQSSTKDDQFTKMFWEMGYISMKKFFETIKQQSPVSLTKTKKVLRKRDQLNVMATGIKPQIDNLLFKCEEIRRLIQEMKINKGHLDQSVNFEIMVEEPKVQKVTLAAGIHTTTCTTCNRTCHNNCAYANDCDKIKCIAMDKNGYCKICPNKCKWDQHFNLPYVFEYTVEKKKIKSEVLYLKYTTYKSHLSKGEQVILGLKKEHEEIIKDLFEKLKEMRQKLDEIALRPNVTSSLEMLELMKESEMQEKKPGFQNRIKSLDLFIEQQKQLKNLTENQADDFIKKQISQYQKDLDEVQQLQNQKDRSLCVIF